MRITSQSNLDVSSQQNEVKATSMLKARETLNSSVQARTEKPIESTVTSNTTSKSQGERKITQEQLQQAVDTMNEFLDMSIKSSKFVLHEGLDKYFVRLVDAETEEVVKEIPSERLLDAFYEMQKLVGIIVDEKI